MQPALLAATRCPCQAQELVCTEGYQANDMEVALRQAYLRMDELLVKASQRWCMALWRRRRRRCTCC